LSEVVADQTLWTGEAGMHRMVLEHEHGPPAHGRDGEGLALGVWLSLECWLGLVLLVKLWTAWA
jgi:hypothetical protein